MNRPIFLLFFNAIALILVVPVQAEIIESTSFEEPNSVDGLYTDTGDAGIDRFLDNNVGEPLVNYTSTGGEIGFQSFYTNTRNGDGLTDGDNVGVTNNNSVVTSYTDGSQGFQIEDADGAMSIIFDTVDISEHGNVEVAFDYFLNSTSYELNDRFFAEATVDSNPPLSLVNTAGSDIDDLGIEGSWITITQPIAGDSVVLTIGLDSNAETEQLFFDNVRFTGNATSAVPFEFTSTLGFFLVGSFWGLVKLQKRFQSH